MNSVFAAFLLSLFAGLSTGIGSAAVFFPKSRGERFMAFTLGFSAGVMLYVSLTEILQKAGLALALSFSEPLAAWVCALSFFGGILLIFLIGRFVPSFEDSAPKELSQLKSFSASRLWRCGIFSALALAIHNFPEGMATFISALRDSEVAIPIVFAVAIHNIPEGVAVASPVYRATGSRRCAFLISFLSGLAEPLGALFCWLILMPIMSDALFGTVFAAAAGIMVYICLDEILPAADSTGHHSLSLLGAILGMAVMALSLLLF